MATAERRYYPYLRTIPQDRAVYEWWEQLQDKPGDRAQLRRCSSPGEVVVHRSYAQLVRQLQQARLYEATRGDKRLAIASVAGLLSHVRYNTGMEPPEDNTASAEKPLQPTESTTAEPTETPSVAGATINRFSFGSTLGSGPSGKGVTSDLRFRRLLQTDDRDTLYRTMIRMIRQLNYSVPVLSFGATILKWDSPLEGEAERTRQQLAFDYYNALEEDTTQRKSAPSE